MAKEKKTTTPKAKAKKSQESQETAQKCSEGNNVTSEQKVDEEESSYRVRNFLFTSFATDKPNFVSEKMKCLGFGYELCPTTGTPHWQSHVYMKQQYTLSAMIKWLKRFACHGEHPNVKIMNGTYKQNVTYCSKDGKYEEYGEPPSQGARHDLDELKTKITEGASVDDIVMDNPIMYHQYGRTLDRIEAIHLRTRKRTEMTKGLWFYGPTGTGKSHKAFEMVAGKSYYVFKDDKGWWDGYTGQEVVIINDFRGEIRFGELLQMTDKWDYSVRRRGKEPMPFTSSLIIITASLPPNEVYNGKDKDSIDQLLRRYEVTAILGNIGNMNVI